MELKDKGDKMDSTQKAILELMDQRTTLRSFSERPVEPELEELIIKMALRAPTASNMMYYSVITIHDKELQRALQKTCNNQPYISQAPCMLVFCADYQRLYDFYEYGNVPEKCRELERIYLYPSEKNMLLCTEDAVLAAENAVLAAQALGMGSCFIGHIMDHCEIHRQLFNLPPLVFPVLALLIGYPPDNYKPVRRPRFEQTYIVHENTYHRLTKEELDGMYGTRFHFVPENRYKANNAAQQLYLSKYASSECYAEGVRSVKKAFENWRGEPVMEEEYSQYKEARKDGRR